jgi:indole-3-acetate monooxygenase
MSLAAVIETQESPLTLDDVIAEITQRREEFERLSHVPRDVIDKLKQVGIYRAATPRRFGGDARAPGEFLELIERIATADGSAAWVASFGSANLYLAALPLATQAEIYADGPDQCFAGGLFPVQNAAAEGNGYRVNGTWKFASGCKGADWLGVGIGTGKPGEAPGKPRTAVFRPQQVEIVENWNVVGMQGTGSHDLRVTNQFVAEDWTFVRGGTPTVDEPLYRYPTVAYAAQVLAVVNLGLARAALDVANNMAGGRKTTTVRRNSRIARITASNWPRPKRNCVRRVRSFMNRPIAYGGPFSPGTMSRPIRSACCVYPRRRSRVKAPKW